MHPELKMYLTKQIKKGLQSSALAMAVLAAAENIEDLTPIVPAIMPVVYKHCALQVQPEHYDIVGENLIWAIQEVTGLENNDPIIQTWIKAYGAIADTFIGLEKIFINKWHGKVLNHLKLQISLRRQNLLNHLLSHQIALI